jgi:hypothetical protein
MKSSCVWLLAALFILQAVPAVEAKRSAADQALYERARKECNSARTYPSGAIPIINYKGGWFRFTNPVPKAVEALR